MPPDHFHSIRLRFVLTITGVMLLLLALFCWNSVREYRVVIASAENHSTSNARVLKEHVERAISEADNALFDIVDHLQEHGPVEGLSSKYIDRTLSSHFHNSPQISSLFMIDRHGLLLAHAGSDSFDKTMDLSGQDFFTHHRELPDNTPYISKTFMNSATGRWQFTLSRPIRSAAARLDGVVAATFDVNYFATFYSSMDMGNSSRILLVRTDGQLILAMPFAESIFEQDFRKSKLFREQLPNAASGTYRIASGTTLLGEPGNRIVSYMTLNGYPVVVLANISQDEAVAQWRAAFVKQGLVAGLLALLVTILSILFLRQLKNINEVNLSLVSQRQELQVKAELLDLASDAIFVLDEQGGVVQFNNALCCLTGRSREELEMMRIQDLKPPGDAGMFEERFQRIRENSDSVFESVYLHVSGTVVPVEVHARPIEIGHNPHILCVLRDISDRKDADAKIMKAVKEWQNTFNAVEDVVWLLDMDRKIVRANRSTERVFSKPSQDVIGLSCCEAAHGDMDQALVCPFDEMLKLKGRASIQLSIAGRWFEVSVDPVFSEDGAITNAVHIVKDIDELKKAELREHVRSEILEKVVSGEPLSQLLSFIAVSIEKENPGMLCSILLVTGDGKRLVNGAAPSLPDFYNIATNNTKIGEGIGSCGTAAFRRKRVIVEDVDCHPFWKGFAAVREAGLRSCWSEPIISSSGALLGTFAIYHRTPALPGDDELSIIQQASAFAGIAIERSKGETERIELEHLLVQAQKMEAIGHLSGGIAHDFNNLLTPILIYSEMLKRLLPDNEKAQSQLEGIIRASGKARDLTQQLLSFGRKQVMQMQVVDLNDVIRSFHSIVRRTIRENIGVTLQLAGRPVVARIDSSKIEQVLLNLVLNAQDAIADNGSIVIETGHILIDDEFAGRHPGMQPGRFVLLSCTDNGCGMNAEILSRVFEPFFSTKEVGHGTGLGLANVYGIVKQHNGYITAVSTVGAGTSFKIYLPICDGEPQSVAAGNCHGDIDHSGRAAILLVEDNEMVRVMSRDLLESFGYTVYCAEHPERALELLREITDRIDLVITDIVMPGMDGQQLFERITADHPEIDKVLYMSGYTNNVIVTAGELDEGLHFLQKPFTVDALMAKVKGLLQPDG